MPSVHLLKTVSEHWSVHLVHQIAVDAHNVIGGYAEEVRVVGSVMDLAHAESVVDDRNAVGLVVTDYVCRIEKAPMLE